MKWISTTSGKIVIILTMIFAFSTFEKIEKVNTGEKTCNCAYDGFGYYMYLPHLFNKGNLDIKHEWAQRLQDEYCNGQYVYQLMPHETGHNIDIYHMGLSSVILPSYSAGHIFAKSLGYKTDGFSYPYMIAYLLNALLFIFLGLLYLRKLLRLFTDELRASIILIGVALGTNAYLTFNIQYDLPHLYLFALNAISSYHLIRFNQEDRTKSLWISAIIFGLTVFIRPTQALFGIIPLILLYKKYGKSLELIKKLALFPIMAFIWNIPQFIYWKIYGGSFLIPNLHTEDIVLSDPNLIDFLFSYRKGWLLYSPLFIFIPIGWLFMYKKHRIILLATGSFSLVYIYIMSSWECWWYASSFGSRAMVDIYPVLAISFAFLLNEIRTPIKAGIVALFSLACIYLNLFQSEQVKLGILDGHRMTKEHYWLIFGELDPKEVHHRWLLIPRGDVNWPNHLSKFDDNPFKLKTRQSYRMKKPLISLPGKHEHIDKIPLLKTFETDETLLEIPIKFRTSDSTQSSVLRLESISKWNCYSWDNIELSLGKPQNQIVTDTLRFNLPDIRHNNDEMQIYIWNESSAKIELLEFKIIATSLIRN